MEVYTWMMSDSPVSLSFSPLPVGVSPFSWETLGFPCKLMQVILTAIVAKVTKNKNNPTTNKQTHSDRRVVVFPQTDQLCGSCTSCSCLRDPLPWLKISCLWWEVRHRMDLNTEE